MAEPISRAVLNISVVLLVSVLMVVSKMMSNFDFSRDLRAGSDCTELVCTVVWVQ